MRGEHVGAVYAAKQKIADVQEQASGLTTLAEEATRVVASATGGENCGSQSGRGAFERMLRVPDLINDVYNTLTEASTELDAYANEI